MEANIINKVNVLFWFLIFYFLLLKWNVEEPKNQFMDTSKYANFS